MLGAALLEAPPKTTPGPDEFVIRLPSAGEHRGFDQDQDQEWCEVTHGGTSRRVRFHDYSEIYKVPRLYERLFYAELQCSSPNVVSRLLRQALQTTGYEPSSLRVLDVGAGNGLVGEAVRGLGVSSVVGVDILDEAGAAAQRDRPHVYDDYVVADLTELTDEQRVRLSAPGHNCLTCVAALGFGDMPPEALLAALRFISPTGWVAFCIKERFLEDEDPGGFADLMNSLIDDGSIEVLERQRYRHRLSATGRPLYYEAIVARRTAT